MRTKHASQGRLFPGELAPAVDVALVPVSIDMDRSVVDVALVPMEPSRYVSTRLAKLRTLGDVQAAPRATPKPSTKLDRALAKKAARLLDAKQLRAWALAVKTRDQWTDRKTGLKVRSTRQLDPLRAEAHHIVSKDDPAVRYDVRNGICLSFATHFLVERNVLRIEGTVFFRKGGCRYIDATYPVTFVRV